MRVSSTGNFLLKQLDFTLFSSLNSPPAAFRTPLSRRNVLSREPDRVTYPDLGCQWGMSQSGNNGVGEWTIVLPRRGKQRRNSLKIVTQAREELQQQQKKQPWVPMDLEYDPNRQSKLTEKMKISMKKVENSQFYQTLLQQIRSPDVMNSFHRIRGAESNMPMVIYGIGSIESYETPRTQLSVAILMKKELSWIGEIEVFDPILSATECGVLQAFGCRVGSINEHGQRCAARPMLFYMPHCEAELYDNLLQANWSVELLNRIALFGNSFRLYRDLADFGNSMIVDTSRHIVAVGEFTCEHVINSVSDDYFAAFHDSSWHFFCPHPNNNVFPKKPFL